MLGLTADIIVICLVLMGLAMVCAAWGRATFSMLGIAAPKYFDCGALWLGFTSLLAFLECWHLFAPIDWRASIFVFLVSLLPFLSNQNRFEIKASFQNALYYSRQHYLQIFLICLIALIWCLRSMGLSNNFDSGLYHFGSIRWLNEYPIVPGLGNVHWRFALNQSYFGFLSLVNIYPFWNKGYAVGGLFLLILASLTLMQIARTQDKSWRLALGGVVFIYLGYLAGTLPNPSPDTAVGLLEIAIFLLLFRVIKNQRNDTSQNLRDAVVILFLSFSLVTVKLSSVMFAVASICVVFYFQFIEQGQNYRRYLKVFALLLLLSSVHILRGYLLSGLPLFPSTLAGAWQLDWAVPFELVKFEINLIYSWARQPGEMVAQQVLGHWGWIPSWLDTIPIFEKLMFGLATILTSVNFVAVLIQKDRATTKDYQYLILYLPIWPTFVFWFLTAPDPRFLGAVPALYIGVSLWMAHGLFIKKYIIKSERYNISSPYLYWLAALLICLMSLKLTGLRSMSFEGWTPIPHYSTRIEKTRTDLPVNVSTVHGQCWDAPLPCVSIFNGNLQAIPLKMPWPLSLLSSDRFFYSVKFLNLSK
jgi:hypothetical protein